MFMLRLLGGWAILTAIVALVYDLTHSYQTDAKFVFASLGKDWYAISPSTLNLLQASVERHMHPILWDPVLLSLLKAPATGVFAVLGVGLYAIGLRRRRTNIFAN